MKQFESRNYDVIYIEPDLFDVEIINSWYLETKSKYKKFIDFINKFKFKKSWCEAYAWCDISDFEYWKTSNTYNYVILTIKHKNITPKRKEILEKLIEETETKFNKKYSTLT